ncbi:MAG: hypothetical protein Q9167_007711 [Letrouitia subvulpina]
MGYIPQSSNSSNEQARSQEYWRAIAIQHSISKASSPAMIDRKWVHQVQVPTVLNRLRLQDSILIVFDPIDATFAVLNSNLIYGNDYTEIPLPSYHYRSILDVITVFEDVGSHKRKPGTKNKRESKKIEVSAEISSKARMPIHKYVVEKKRGPYKRGIRSARLPIVTFPLIALGYVVFLKRFFWCIRTLHVLTPGLGPVQQSTARENIQVEDLTVEESHTTAKEKGQTKKSLYDFAGEGNDSALLAALREPSVEVD